MALRESISNFTSKTISLRWVLGIVFAFQVLVFGCLAGYFSYQSAQTAVGSLAETNHQRLIIVSVTTLLLAIGISVLTARWIAEPILQLSQVSKTMAQGEWQVSLSEGSKITEIKILATSFNAMAAKLHQSFEGAEVSLKESQEKYQVLFQTLPIGIAITDPEGKILDGNPASEIILGVSTQEITARKYDGSEWQILRPDGSLLPSTEYPSVRALEQNRFIRDQEIQVVRPDGSRRSLSVSAAPIPLEKYGVAIVYTDITELKQVEMALKQSETRFLEISESSPANIYILVRRVDGSIYFEYMSRAIESIHEISVEMILEDAGILLKCIHPEDIAGYGEAFQRSLVKLQPFSHQWRVITPSGKTKWLQGNSHPKRRDHGEIAWYGVVTDITDRKEAEIALAEAKAVAESATRAKSEFLANMSHEIRTPMSGVLGMAQLLASSNLTTEQNDFVQTIQESGEALLQVINQILDFSKIESGKFELVQETFVLEDVVKSVTNLLGSQARNQKIDLQYSLDPMLPVAIAGDRDRLRQVLVNLVGNAIKFTKQGGVSISVSGRLCSNLRGQYELTFAVKDSGSGIDRDRLDKLFQPFTQADASISRKYGGTGLGLAISKGLVELMGGTIWVESFGCVGGQAPANWISELNTQGSIFCFSSAVFVRSAIAPRLNNRSQIAIDSTMAEKFPLQILVVDDGLVNQKLASYMFAKLGYEIDLASNGCECIKKLSTKPYDVILMDMQMPEMDGLSATKIIRKDLTQQSQPWIVALTANALTEDREKCLAAGMDDYISKPVRMPEVIRAFEKFLEAKKVEKLEISTKISASFSPSGEPDLPAIDMSYFQMLHSQDLPTTDNQTYLSIDEGYEILGLIIDDTNATFQTMQSAMQQKDLAQISFSVHSLKSIGLMFNAMAFVKLCVDLEAMAKSNQLLLSVEWEQKFFTEYERFMKALKNEHQQYHDRQTDVLA
jgi:PAS domain S-box-containing protein